MGVKIFYALNLTQKDQSTAKRPGIAPGVLKAFICTLVIGILLFSAMNAEAVVTLSPEGWSIGGTAVTGSASTLNHANGTGTNRVIIIYVVVETNGTQSITGVTYGGAPVTPITTAQEPPGGTTWNNVSWLGYCNEACITSATGTTIVPSYSNGSLNFDGIAAATFTGVDQATPINNFNSANLAGMPLTTTINNAAGNMAIYGVEFNGVGANSITPAANFTEGGEFDTGGNGFRMEAGFSTTPGTPLTVNPTTGTTSNRTTIVATSINAAVSDLIAPSSSVTVPADGSTVNSGSPNPYTVSGSATDNAAVSSIQISINGGAWQTAACTGCPGANVTWTYSWVLPADGSYTIRSRATDSSSNVEVPSAGNTVIVDRSQPASSIAIPANGSALNGASSNPLAVSGSATDNAAVSGIEVSINGGVWQSAACTGCPGANVTWTYSWNLPADGSYTIQSRALDSAGNIETPSAGNNLTIDRTAPFTSSTTPSNGAINVPQDSSVTINWNENIDCGTVTVITITSNSPGWTISSCSGSQAVFSTSGQAGTTTYSINITTAVMDANGNPMASDYLFSYTTADAGAPSSIITNPANGTSLNSTSPDPYTVSGSATDNTEVSGIEISINGGAWQPAACTGCPGANVTWSYLWTLPADGSYTIQSRAADSSGNVETPGAGNTVTIDRTAPSVSSTTPTDTASGVVLNSSVTINWNENVDCATVNATNVTISPASGWSLLTCNASQAIFTTGSQSDITTYTVTVSTAVTDASGNAMPSSYIFSYTTEDAGAPSSVITNPADGTLLSSSAPSPYTVSGTATDNVAVSGIQISVDGGAWQSAACSGCPGANVTWTYVWTLPADGSYTIQSRATDSSSNVETPGAGNTVTIDRTAPNISSTIPSDGAIGVALNSSVTIVWNENINCSTVNILSITSTSPGWSLSSCSGSQAVFNTSSQAGSTLYTLSVSTAVTDTAGNPMATEHIFSYSTTASSDSQKPASTVSVPANGAILNAVSSDPFTISGTASDNISVSGVEISVNGGPWTAAACTGCPGPNVTWTYNWTLPADGVYTIRSRAKDQALNAELPSVGNTITLDRTDPLVSSTIPANTASGVPVNSIVTINWNENVDCSTVTASTITSDSPGWSFYSCNAKQAIFTTNGQNLSTTYNVTVTSAVTDIAGNTMTVAHLFSYTTSAQLGQELVRNQNFNTGTEWTVTLENTQSGSGFFQYDPSKSQAADGSGSVQAHEEGQNFSVKGTIIQQIFAPAGSTIDNVSIWSEHASSHDSTGDVVDIELRYADPTIPGDGETDVPLNSNVTINFGEPMDCSTITTSNITMSSGGWSLFSCSGTQAVFNTSGQTNNTTYTVTVTINVTDAAGNALVSPFVFSYTTIP